MSCDKVEAYFYVAFVGFPDKINEVAIGAEAGIYLIEIDDIIASVEPSGFENRVQPDGVDSHRLNIGLL